VFEEEPLDLLKHTMAVVGPVYLGNRLVGLIFLGKKISGKRYSEYDLEVLQTLCSVSAVTFNNARLFDNVRTSMNEVQKLSDLRDEMISRISHEFRTPLTAIRAVSACVPEFGMPPEMAAAMDSSVTRLAELIDSLLSLNSMRSADYSLDSEVFNPLGPIHEIVSAHAEEATSKTLTFDIREVADIGMVSIRTPQQSFATVIEQLLKNAIRFSDENSSIRIELEGVSREPDETIDGALIMDWRNQTRKTIDEYKTLIEEHGSESPAVPASPVEQYTEPARHTGPYLVVRITNTGIGIPKEELRFMGEPFRQASNSPDQRVKGKALGLAVAQKILADCSGHLCCTSTEGATTTFSVFFPAS
jgi:signal transduction histidine kinase